MLIHRVLAALVFAPALLGLVWWGGLPLAITCLAIAGLMLWEFFQLTLGRDDRFVKLVGYLLGVVAGFAVLGWMPPGLGAALVPTTTMVLMMAMVARPQPLAGAVNRAGLVGLGVLYCVGLMPFLFLLREREGMGLGLGLAALFCTWGADTAAYFTGRFLGRHKLYPTVSPGKTVEGAIGGLLGAVGVAFLIRLLFGVDWPVVDCVVLGTIAGVLGVIGDLAESLLKRSVGAKDSSGIIPGHGGVLDRFDGVMFVAPGMYVYVITMM